MKVVISPDSFKGTLTALEAAQAIEKGIRQVNSKVETILLPVADGGEGTVDALVLATDGQYMKAMY
jgi:glycerate kinase